MEESPKQLACEGDIIGWHFIFKKSLDKHTLGMMSFSHSYHSGGTGTRRLWSFLLIHWFRDGFSEVNTDMLSHNS